MASALPVPSFVQLAAHPVRWQLLTMLSGSDHRVREMVSLIGEPQNLISYHLRLLRDGGLVRATRSSFDGRDSYYHLDLDRCTEMLAGAGAWFFARPLSRKVSDEQVALYLEEHEPTLDSAILSAMEASNQQSDWSPELITKLVEHAIERVHEIQHVRRGYEGIAEKFAALGARIRYE